MVNFWNSSSRVDNKYMYVCHAEMNAVLNKNASSVEDCRIYVALFPCNECAKIIIQSGIKEVILNHATAKVSIKKQLFFTIGDLLL